MTETTPLLRIRDLTILRGGQPGVKNLSLSLDPGGTLAILGEAASGKDALLRLLALQPAHGEDASGTIQIRNGRARSVDERSALDLRIAYLPGPHALVFNPHASVLSQLSLIIARKQRQPKSSAEAELNLALNRLPGAPSLEDLNHPPALITPEILGTALLAAAMAQTPELLLADDPLGELSPAHARALVSVLKSEQERLGFALLYSAARAESVNLLGGNLIILRSGRVVEEGAVSRLATAQSHAYTQTLFQSISLSGDSRTDRAQMRGEPLLHAQGVQLAGHAKHAAHNALNFELRRGASLALIGEIGSGRRALARALLGLEKVAAGRVIFDQVDIGVLSNPMLSRLRRRVAFVTGDDDPLDPRMTIFDTVSEPLRTHLSAPRDLVAHNRGAALKRVGLAALPGGLTVAALSPFDRRRLQIARAIVSQPLLAVIDEPLRGLDAFAQSVIRDLLRNFRANEGSAFLFITSDFGLARAFCEDAFVFKAGRIVERGPISALLRAPQDDQTKKLIDAVSAAPAEAVPAKRAPPVAEQPPPDA